MQALEAWILENPIWVDGPLRIWLVGMFLLMVVLGIRHGRREAREIISRHAGWVFGTLIPVVAWGLYGYTVRSGAGL